MAILDNVEIIKPIFPGIAQETPGSPKLPYDFLASAGLTETVLKNSCVKKAEVVGINTRETITVELDGLEYEDIPVWIHTDVGTRLQMVKDVPLVEPSDYFKHSALMFPLPECEVLVLVFTDPDTLDKEVICAFHVLKGPTGDEFPLDTTTAFPTYRMYARFALFSDVDDAKYYLYDILEDQIAVIPTIATAGAPPALPFVTCDGLSTTDEPLIANFCANGIEIGVRSLGIAQSFGDVTLGDSESECVNETSTIDPGNVYTQGPINYGTTTPGTQYEEYEMQCYGGNFLESYTLNPPPYEEGDVTIRGELTETMPLIYRTAHTYINASSCFGVHFYTNYIYSTKYTLPDSEGIVRVLVSGETNKWYEYRKDIGPWYNTDCSTFFADDGEYEGEVNNKLTLSCYVNLFDEPEASFTWDIDTSEYYKNPSDDYNQGTRIHDKDYYNAVRLGKLFRVQENLFADFVSISFFMFTEYTVETEEWHYCPTPVDINTVTTEKKCIGPSKDMVKDSCLVNDLNMTSYAYSELENYIMAGSYDLTDFLDGEANWPCGIVFSGFYFVPYDIREDLL